MSDPRNPVKPDPGTDREMLIGAIRLVVSQQFAAVTNVQRKMRIGFGLACRLFNYMEGWGVIAPTVGTKAHDVLMTADEAEAVIAELRHPKETTDAR